MINTLPVRFFILLCAALLAACGGSSSSSPATNISGLVINDRLANALVQVFDPDGKLLEETRSGEDGGFSVKVRPPQPYYLVQTSGGHMVGTPDEPYQGQLRARCLAPERPRDGLQCDVTPWTTLVALLMDQGYSQDEVDAMLLDVVGSHTDAFAAAGQSDAVDEQWFDLDAARSEIGNGDGLAAWLDDFSQWVTGQSDDAPPGAPRYTLSVTAGSGGGFLPSPVQVRRGDTASISLQPDAGYYVDNVTGCAGTLVGDVYTTAPIVPDWSGELCEIAITFALYRYQLDYSADEGGTLNGETHQQVSHGQSAQPVTAIPATGYLFNGWSDGHNQPERTDADIQADLAVTAHFSLSEYNLVYRAGAGGSLSGATAQTVAHGTDGSQVTAMADFGYQFVQWSDGLTSQRRADLNVQQDLEVTAGFALNEYSLSYSAGAGGTLSGATAQTVAHGTDGSQVTAMADTGFSFVQWSDGLTNSSRTDTNVQGDLTVTAGFDVVRYSVTYSAGNGGSINGQTNQQVTHGGNSNTVTAVAAFGYQFDQWNDGLTSASRQDTNVQGSISRTASFSPLLPIPQNLQAAPGDEQVTLTWDAVIGATGYNLYYGTQSGIDPGNYGAWGATLVPGVSDGHVVTGLTNGTDYFFRVTATDATDEGPASAQASATPSFIPVGGLNDTGIDWCADNTTNYSQGGTLTEKQTGCDNVAGTHPGQDGMTGRDAQARSAALGGPAFPKTGDGDAGFDFTKVCNSGQTAGQGSCPADPALGGGANDWACTRDNVTGLIWEVKVNDPTHLRHMGHTYTWYNTNPTTNGGNAGTANGGICTGSACDTQSFVAAVNATGLCGATDWRMPENVALQSIVHYGRTNPAIDTVWFPNTPSSWFWSSSPYADYTGYAWGVGFDYGYVYAGFKSDSNGVRLVRAGQ